MTLSKNVKHTPTGSPPKERLQTRSFGLRYNRCNHSSKTSTDHQLLLSAINSPHHEETPHCMSGAHNQGSAFVSDRPKTKHPSVLDEEQRKRFVGARRADGMNRWEHGGEGGWFDVAAVFSVVRVWKAMGRSARCCLLNRSQSSTITTVDLAAASTGQTPVDPFSK